MKWSNFGIWSLVFLLFCCDEIRVCFACKGCNHGNHYHGNHSHGNHGSRNVITWDDLSLGGRKPTGNHASVIVVDPHGHRGHATTVSAAIQMVPNNNKQRVKIHILPGVYHEKVTIPVSKPYISLIGDPKNPSQTVITGHATACDSNRRGGKLGTTESASVTIQSDYFCASGITFQNTVGPGCQAVAANLMGNKTVLYRVRFIGSQDTLLDMMGSHYFYQCFIQGATDFICGNGRSIYNQCHINVVSPGYAIAAQHRRKAHERSGFSFINCTITGKPGIRPYLGRAWADYSRIIYSFCEFDIDINSEVWNDMGVKSRHRTAFFGEYKNKGKGASKRSVEPWAKALTPAAAKPFLAKSFIDGQEWLEV